MRPNKLSASNSEKEFWLASAEKVLALLNKYSLDYVLINYLDVPYTNMRDLDVLVENDEERARLISILEREGYRFYRNSPIEFFSNNKLTYVSSITKLEIDLYPKLAWSWWKIPYSPRGLISYKKIKVPIGEEYAYVPSYTFNLYATVVHSHAHSKISLAEVAYVTKLLLNHNRSIDWDSLLLLSRKYGIEHTLYIHLLLANEVTRYLGKDLSNVKDLIDLLSKQWMSILLHKKMLNNLFRKFPLQYPYITRFLSIPNEHLCFHLRERKSWSSGGK